MGRHNSRKIVISILLTDEEIRYLDLKIKLGNKERNSRSALLRYLVRNSMERNLL